ncbi:HlyD family efflux transporter periplasmic adaptor subunit [Natranaerovirga pectinivora]|uniref:HlyD family efflux transporter periplasmic adaptor subunit n=1 Tax=Natranaerovirga pectinivora TaxID=682400 RepID=UPI00104AA7AB|nr:HlyD family efflux transporter periplasmic adaptor subunit [Natranaerovirga pectinivora]
MSGKVIQYKKRRPFNIGLIIYSVILIYIIISVFTFISRKNPSRFEAISGSIREGEFFTGIIIRDEEVINSPYDGYVSYFFRNGDRASRETIICTIDRMNNRRVEEISRLNRDELNVIQYQVSNFKSEYNDSYFNSVYDLTYKINNSLIEFNKIVNNNNIDMNGMNVIRSKYSGIISYRMDGLEELSLENVDTIILSEKVTNEQLLTNRVSVGDPLYKIINSQKWYMVFEPTESLLNYIENRNTLNINLFNDRELTGLIIEKNSGKIVLEFNHSVNDFTDYRFMDFEIIYNDIQGIKIPNSAIISKSFYRIPRDFVTRSGSENGIMRATTLDDGSQTVQFIPFAMNYLDDDYYYIRDTVLNHNDVIIKPNSTESFRVDYMVSLEGVYDSIRGFAQFKLIEKVFSNNAYTIVKQGTPYGIRLYDHIIMNANEVEENEIVY